MTSDEQKACDEACAKHVADHIFSNEKMEAAAAAAFKAGWEAKVEYKPRFRVRQVWKCEACGINTLAHTEGDARDNLIQYSKTHSGLRGSVFDQVDIANCKHFNIVPVQPA